MSGPLVVGFDLDLTLLDSRPGIVATYRALSELTGVYIDVEAAVNRLGPPLTVELAYWFPPERMDWAGEAFRTLYADHAIENSPLLPGAADAMAAVTAAGGQVVVITGKYGPNAQRHLDHLGLTVAGLVGWAWADGKVAAIHEYQVGIYVGDHPADMIAARTAGATAVGVTTGSHDAAALRAAGADLVLPDLTSFADRLATISVGKFPLGR